MAPHRLFHRPHVVALSFVVLLTMTGPVARPAADDQSESGEHVPTPGEVTQGELRAVSSDGAVLRFPLQHTDVKASVAGLVAHVEVVQTFGNPYDRPIEAVYVFPLPNRAAVDAMEIHLEGRVIRGIIKKREEARAAYEAARREGRTAALLDQERPNIFTQSVANILPGDAIEVHLRYFETLPYHSGRHEFVFPMVVGPRFIPGAPVGHGDHGSEPDTTDVPDASRITPPVMRPEQRSGHDIALEVRLDGGVRAIDVTSPSHRVEVDRDGEPVVRVRLAAEDAIANRDFVLRYGLEGGAPNLIVLPHRPMGKSTTGYFLALLRPEAEPPPSAVTPKEMIFVVDCSGSMSGEPIAKVREAMNHALQNLSPLDNFQIIRFSNTAQAFAPEPVPATPTHIARALGYVERLSGSGGTIMLEGVKAALGYPEDPQRLRIISFMTDGYIGNEDRVLAYLRDHLGSARLHSFGVGSSVNRHLLDSMAEFGRGSVEYILLRENAGGAMQRFYDRISRPYLTDITIDWGGLKVADVYPPEIPDLFLGEPIRLSGRYLGPGVASVRVRGRLGGRPWEGRFDVRLPEHHPEGYAVATLWARAHIDDLSKRLVGKKDQELVEQVTTTALAHNLVSAYTSFVAIDEKIRNIGAPPDRVAVPVPIPEGVDRDMAVGTDHRLVDAVTGGATASISVEYIEGLPILGMDYQDVLTLVNGVASGVAGNREVVRGARDTSVVELKERMKVTTSSSSAPGKAPKEKEGGVSGPIGGALGGVVSGVVGGFLGGLADTPETNQGALEVICRIESTRGEYRVGEVVGITLTITNLSTALTDVPAALSPANGSARFQVLNDRREALADPPAMCTDSPRRSLKPGESVIFHLPLNEAGGYRLDAPGTYWLVFLGSDYGLADSNRLTIVIRRD